MPFGPTHILIPIFLIEIYRVYFAKNRRSRGKFIPYYFLAAAIGGVFPDLDIGAYYVLYFFGFTLEQVHRTFLHTLFIPLIFLLIGLLIHFKEKKPNFGEKIKWKHLFVIAAFGSFIHLVLDALLDGVIMPFFPITNYSIGFRLIEVFPLDLQLFIQLTLDAVFMFLWILWMEFKLRISS